MTELPAASSAPSSQEDLQIEISANTDLFAVMVTRADSRVESVVCIPRGRTMVRQKADDGSRPDPERFKSPIKDGRRSALGDRWMRSTTAGGGGDSSSSSNTTTTGPSTSSRVQYILDDFEDEESSSCAKPPPHSGQRFHLRIAYPNGFIKRRTVDGGYRKSSTTTAKD